MRLVQTIEGNDGEEYVYSGEVTPLPGCPDIAVSHAVYCHGLGGRGCDANKMRLSQLKKLGYSAVLCTVNAENVKQLAILRKCRWVETLPILNKRTDHIVYIFTKQLG